LWEGEGEREMTRKREKSRKDAEGMSPVVFVSSRCRPASGLVGKRGAGFERGERRGGMTGRHKKRR